MDEKQKINELIKQYQEAIHTQNVQNFRSLWTCDENNIMISVVKKFYGIDVSNLMFSQYHCILVTSKLSVKFNKPIERIHIGYSFFL